MKMIYVISLKQTCYQEHILNDSVLCHLQEMSTNSKIETTIKIETILYVDCSNSCHFAISAGIDVDSAVAHSLILSISF